MVEVNRLCIIRTCDPMTHSKQTSSQGQIGVPLRVPSARLGPIGVYPVSDVLESPPSQTLPTEPESCGSWYVGFDTSMILYSAPKRLRFPVLPHNCYVNSTLISTLRGLFCVLRAFSPSTLPQHRVSPFDSILRPFRRLLGLLCLTVGGEI